MLSLVRFLKQSLRAAGIEVLPAKSVATARRDFDAFELDLVAQVRPFSMTSVDRLVVLSRAVDHLARRNIRGAIVECGVWKGGSMMAVARTLMHVGVLDRELYLFDTFEGMAPPTSIDLSVLGQSASEIYEQKRCSNSHWAKAGLEEVRANLLKTGYPSNLVRFVVGKVEDTLPARAPGEIALLRLDTDWYESTKHELETLWPRVVSGGIVIFDDYGHWQGHRRAVDEYFESIGTFPFLNRIDYAGRLVVKS